MRHLARPVSRHTHRYETFDVMSHYVCAFRGRRDNYQVPLTLAEAGQLDRFITDAYVPAGYRRLAAALPLPSHWNEMLARRCEPGIPQDRVRCLWATTALEHSRHHLGFPRTDTFAKLDQHFSRAAAARARRAKTNLFLYRRTPGSLRRISLPAAHTPQGALSTSPAQ